MYVDLDAVGVAGADADEEILHQPAVLLAAGFEFRHRAEIDLRGIDDLVFGDAVEQLFRAEADADVLDIDDGAVVQFEGVFRLQLGKAVRADGLEIGADGKDRSLDAVAEDFTTEDRDHPPDAMSVIAGDDRRADPDGEAEDCLLYTSPSPR